MTHQTPAPKPASTPPSSTTRTLVMYAVGFIGSLALTVTAYLLVTNEVFDGWTTAIVISVLALIQCVVQLLFFLHLNQESRPRWQLWTLLSMLAIFIVVVFGSIWVMYDLNDRMMPPHDQMMEYMERQAGF